MSRREFLTPQGWDALQEEIQSYWERRKHTVAALSEAAAEGDRSENAEYIYRKKELREIDRRIRYLDRVRKHAEVVRTAPADGAVVRFGAFVSLEQVDSGEAYHLRLVGAYEAEPREGRISIAAPLSRALMGKSLEDIISWQRGDECSDWEIVNIRYEV